MNITTDIRVRSKLGEDAMQARAGKCPGDRDYDVLLDGPTRVSMLDGRPLCVYLPGVLKTAKRDDVYDVLHELRSLISRNRGLASGTKRFKSNQTRSYTKPIASGVIGAIDPTGQQRYCRLTAWTGSNLPKWAILQPLLEEIAGHFREHVPDRYEVQMRQIRQTDPAWVVEGTPFTTVTVNNTYPTGVHTDKGDLAEGFSTIACLRRGDYTGGKLVFPQYRIAADLRDGDLILMDAHQWHGNTKIMCACGTEPNGMCRECRAERITVVSYMRQKLVHCGSPEDEVRKADAYRARVEQGREV